MGTHGSSERESWRLIPGRHGDKVLPLIFWTRAPPRILFPRFEGRTFDSLGKKKFGYWLALPFRLPLSCRRGQTRRPPPHLRRARFLPGQLPGPRDQGRPVFARAICGRVGLQVLQLPRRGGRKRQAIYHTSVKKHSTSCTVS